MSNAEHYWVRWKIWQVRYPLTLIVLVGFLANLTAKMQWPFLRIIGSCDLILFSALLLLSVTLDLEVFQMDSSAERDDPSLDSRLQNARYYALTQLAALGLLRVNVLKDGLFDGTNLNSTAIMYLVLNVLIVASSVIFALYAYARKRELDGA